jgi:glycerol-3-phosphate O-acyltransferase/dihydroxyacetone phosphate acyltransferase
VQRLVYSLLVVFLRLVTRVFFRTIEVVGRDHVPVEGPVIFVGNHPSSLVDPVVITTTCGRRVRFAARDGLFATPVRPILWALGSVPIKRRQDQGEGTAKVDNAEAFSALHAVLAKGEAFGIFPEGVSYTEPELQPLKTGAARIALSAFAEGIPVTIVPVGLHYRRKQHFRGRVLVQFGRPLRLDTRAARWAEDPRAAARELTADIELALRALTLNAKDFDTLRVLDGIRRLYVPIDRELSLADEAEVTRRLVAHWEAKKDAPDVAAFYAEVESWLAILDALGLSDHDLRAPMSRMDWVLRVLRHVALLVIDVPLALPGLVLHAPILWGATRAGEMVLERDDVKATFRMVVAVLAVLFTHLVVGALILLADPTPGGALRALVVTVFLGVSGLAAIRVLEKQAIVRHGLRVLARLLSMRGQLDALRAQRDALCARIPAIAEVHADPAMDRIVSNDELRAAHAAG